MINQKTSLTKLKELDSVISNKAREIIERQKYLILNSITDAVIITDMIGKIKFANPSTYELLEYDPKEILGLNIEYIIKNKNKINTGHGCDLFLRKKSGLEITAYVYAGELKEEDNNLLIFVIHKDD